MTLGERLRKAREYAGLTQVQLAEKTRLTQQTISLIESGTNKESAAVVRLAMACGVRPEWLAEEQGDMVDSYHIRDEHIRRLAMVAERLPAYAVDQLSDQGDALAKLIEQAQGKAATQ
jgi:transcriptional regulator with XRE-family HTH domain